MKKNLLLGFISMLFLSSSAFGQTGAPKSYTYAEVTIHIGGYNKYKSTEISFGTDYPVTVDKKEEISAKVLNLKNGPDVKNYMGDQGWEFIDQQSMLFNDMLVIYTFRKPK